MLALVVSLRAGFACKEDMYNYLDELCVTADECSSMGSNHHAYKVVGRCISSKFYGDNQPIKQADGSYECEEDFYLRVEYNQTTCVKPKNGCDGLHMLQGKKVCADSSACS